MEYDIKEKKKRPQNTNLKLIKNGDMILTEKGRDILSSPKPYTALWEKLKFWEDKKLRIIGIGVLLAMVLLLAAGYYVLTSYRVNTVYVEGNIHYTNEEITEMVMSDNLGNNSLYLALKYKDRGVENIPFVEKMDVTILSPDSIRISVYEKPLAGYVEYLGRYMYFDKDGTVVESSNIKTAGVAQVTGLDFPYVVLNEPLPVENKDIFQQILNITQLLSKYELITDKIFFDYHYNLTLYFGEVKVLLGKGDTLEGKIMRLQYILPELEGKKGILQMENYDENSKNIPFHQENAKD